MNSGEQLYEDVILLTLQLLYYRNWVSRIKYTHGQPYYGTHGKSWNTREIMEHTGNHGTHGKSWNTREIMEHTGSLLSVLVAVTHTHPTITSMFIPPQRLIRPPGCI
jgi:hypothetical protein